MGDRKRVGRPLKALAMVVPVALLLTSCGDDSNDGGSGAPPPAPPPAPTNLAPSFTSPTATSVAENTSGIIYTAVATDPEGSTLTYTLGGGADASAFSITSAGALSFVQAPDFERPGDADGNNVYRVQINASDGVNTASMTVDVTITNAPDMIGATRVATGLASPQALIGYPQSSSVIVVEKPGRARLLDVSTGNLSPFLDVTADVSTTGDRGLLGFAFAPDFETSRRFYVYLTNRAGEVEVRRYRTQGNTSVADSSSGDVILKFALATEFNQGGWLAFGADGFLYIGTGDGAAARANADAAFGGTGFSGKILRIDPSRDDFPADDSRDYGLTPSTRFGNEIWAIGIRNLNHGSFDPATSDLWFADTALTRREVNRLLDGEVGRQITQSRTVNYGWNRHDGTSIISGAGFPGITNCCFPPVLEYVDGDATRTAGGIVGGYVYRGPIAALRGEYIFADGATLRSFALSEVPPLAGVVGIGSNLDPSAVKARNSDFAPNAGSYTSISGFGVDGAGNLYILDSDGEIFRLDAR